MATTSGPIDATAALAQRVESWTGDQLAEGLSAELGHLLAEAAPDSAGARALRLSLARAAQRARGNESAERAARDAVRLLSAYESSRRSIEDDAALVRDLDEAALEILRKLALGPATASQLTPGRRDNGKLSRRLKALEEQGLIERAVAEDKRARPKALTVRGRVLVEQLEAATSMTTARARFRRS